MTTTLDLSAATWLKASYSNSDGGACVEVAPGFAVVPVRDSKDPSAGHLIATPASWMVLLDALRAV
ncbi:DUF397 domain-containing protein [Embleya sp. NPDC008237]|uniref:DUF397 domain-containing protein n=1 Tax=Embleya sp. NPDC008237 TaxID=3363978 RepID=UPI0036EB270F